MPRGSQANEMHIIGVPLLNLSIFGDYWNILNEPPISPKLGGLL